jgi:cell division protein ZapE
MINLTAAYHARLVDGDLRPDAAQEQALVVLQKLANALRDYKPRPYGLLSRFLANAAAPRGLYLYGAVGRGKSMLMDSFYESVPIAKKRRVHFHQFMLEIHDRLHQLQNDHAPDILPRMARAIAAEAWLLCFDEFHVGNIADAMILGRLFQALFEAGVVIVTTSNWAPDQLYKNGLQRERFLPFIDLIKERMDIYYLDGAVDHRFEQTQKLPGCFYPLNTENTHKLQNIFFQLTNNVEPEVTELRVQGRVLRMMHAAKGIGFFNFDELCVSALGPADYLALAESLHTVLIDGVPKMDSERRNETMRFINLIDALYEAHVQLYLTAATPPEQLAPEGELDFPFQRTLSRLMEMQGEEYRQKAHLGA